jgi:hypothetical protein
MLGQVACLGHWLACLSQRCYIISRVRNMSATYNDVLVHLTHLYGYPQITWWGCDGLTARYHEDVDAGII